ncbi:E3 ubiquitin-protein ligase Hakai [Thelohanellus kitauei]|uniref:E3 ubiquitin-protein ligase Hakai n=1 Tax=Thelohanellus kitauei TaxID=669202 RepID=A0A0C2JD05_THEKT|nr:E3 ubiquitin-protein ligase Hakai [Thelohanellus kitauei]
MSTQNKPIITFRLKTDLSKLEKKAEDADNSMTNLLMSEKDIDPTKPSNLPETAGNNVPSDSEVPCKHPVCLQCGENLVSMPHSTCAYCNAPISGNEKVPHSQLYCCEIFEPKINKPCGKSYLSQRDLSAHISHRHTTSL